MPQKELMNGMKIKNIFLFFKLECKLLTREHWVWMKMFIIMPINMVLPYYFMAKFFSNYEVIRTTLLTTLFWSYIYFTVFESFLSKNKVIHSEQIYSLLLVPGSLLDWILGQTLAINIFYSFSFFLTGVLLSLLLKFDYFNISLIAILLIISFITSLIFNLFVFSIQLLKNNIFNLFNFSMDVVNILVGVLYPISIMPLLIKPISYLLPLTFAISYIRDFSNASLISCLFLNVIYFIISLFLINVCIRHFRIKGDFS